MMNDRRRYLAGPLAVLACTLVVPACTSAPEPTTAPPSVESVAVDADASLTLNPVDYDGESIAVARFSKAVEGASVSLQHKESDTWKEIATGTQDEDGKVEFLASREDGEFRAVTHASERDGDLTSTPTADTATQWTYALRTEFDSAELPQPWRYSITGSYEAGGRQCSAPYPSNVKLKGGKAVLSMTKETDAAKIAASKAAGCDKGEHYRNGLLDTVSTFTMRTGVVAARIKFSEEQGAHAGIFLLNGDLSAEIDVIESYGYGKGLTSVVHVEGQRIPAEDAETYVNTEVVKDRAWWKDYHVYSAEWDQSEVVFRVDGVETKRIKNDKLEDDYSLYVSQLSSDWELKRLRKPVQNAKGVQPAELPISVSFDWVRAWTPA